MRKLKTIAACLLSAVALAVGLTAGMAGAAQASVTPDPTWNEIWAPYLTAQSNTLCLDAPGGSTSPGLKLQLFHCHGYASDGAPQRWKFEYLGTLTDGYPLYDIKNVKSNLCLTWAVSDITQDTCASNYALWELHSENLWSTDPNFGLVAYLTGTNGSQGLGTPVCMTAGNSTDSNHTPLVATTCSLFSNGLQNWRLG